MPNGTDVMKALQILSAFSNKDLMMVPEHDEIWIGHDISPAEITHILVLAGIYSGISSFADAIGVEVGTLSALKKLAVPNAGSPRQVYDALRAVFPR